MSCPFSQGCASKIPTCLFFFFCKLVVGSSASLVQRIRDALAKDTAATAQCFHKGFADSAGTAPQQPFPAPDRLQQHQTAGLRCPWMAPNAAKHPHANLALPQPRSTWLRGIVSCLDPDPALLPSRDHFVNGNLGLFPWLQLNLRNILNSSMKYLLEIHL